MKNRKRILNLGGIFISLVFLLSACEDNIVSFIDDRGNNTITGKVVDAYGVPLAGIKVELANVVVPNFTYSDAGGNFILDSVKKPYDIAGILRDSVMFGDRTANVF
ncbi:MAG: carboxypeptidase-like regulatory domain-containing protein, partial [Ignavibacteriae bacterium]|nr:carboxypeptidase-like regulatory domain-containing protein [Ignavibacteriota bacterium]